MPRITGNIARNMYKLKKGLMQESENMLGEDGCDQTLSEFWGYALQAHHCISCSVMSKMEKGKLARMARISGYDINEYDNGIALPSYCGHQMVNKEQRHRGGHSDEYYDNVEKKLKPIYRRYKDEDLCKNKENQKNFLRELKSAEDDIKSKIEERKWWLYDWSENLYNGDYRDEGSGNLRSGRPREGSSNDGIQWLDTYGNAEKKRRWIETMIKTVTDKGIVKKYKEHVRKAWYEKYGYPVPKDMGS